MIDGLGYEQIAGFACPAASRLAARNASSVLVIAGSAPSF
jgi:hypothetical protein